MNDKFESLRIFRRPNMNNQFYLPSLSAYVEDKYKIKTGRIQRVKMFEVRYLKKHQLHKKDIINVAYKLIYDPIQHELSVNLGFLTNNKFSKFIVVGKNKEVTDDESMAFKEALYNSLGKGYKKIDFDIAIKNLYLFENYIARKYLQLMATTVLSNPLYEYAYVSGDILKILNNQESSCSINKPSTKWFDINKDISDKRYLGLSEFEISKIEKEYARAKFKNARLSLGLPSIPSDCELELIAQTWSEHCKHKEFNAEIKYTDNETGVNKKIISLFDSYIVKSTKIIQDILMKKGHNWLVKVFSDNAGIVRIDSTKYFVWKVETHNTPSFIEPYGGAITGILGNNRDALGTGIGGAKLVFNTNVLCFGYPDHKHNLLNGQKHPIDILQGVVRGIQDGGNKSGVPTVNGSIHFDDRYAGKPLVFCGTGAVMASNIKGIPSERKNIVPGDQIVMIGGRVGKDGIHGATLSSCEISSETPGTIVQIGSPITQKKLSDFLEKACITGLVKTCTDNGAGGLGSSVGEMAQISNGARIDLVKVPLKYQGLDPWEILISESQERMTLVVDSNNVIKLLQLADKYLVEASCLGEFTDSGNLEILYNNKHVAFLSLDFLHNGVPRKQMEAIWTKPIIVNDNIPKLETIDEYNKTLLDLLSSYNICSRESIIRQYDHDVKPPFLGQFITGIS
ncbi:MAG: hypothetical protein HRT87_06245 [Legionellales bacterium]|nr:hypothetical protein [Legionellales bacterium]